MSVPRLLMLDEPSEGLSPLFTSNVFDALKILESKDSPFCSYHRKWNSLLLE